MLLSLALSILPLTGWAQQACRTIADGIRTAPSSAQGQDTSYRPPLVLDRLPDEVVHFDRGRLFDPAGAVAVLRNEFRASDELQARITRMGNMARAVGLYRFGNTSLHMMKLFVPNRPSPILGEIELLNFFEAPPDGMAEIVDELSVLQGRAVAYGDGPARAIVRVGEIIPALMIESGRSQDVEISVTPWQNGTWQSECTVSVRPNEDLKVSEQLCKDTNCEDFSAQALTLVDQFRTNQPPWPKDKNFKALVRAIEKEVSSQMIPPTPPPFETFDRPSPHRHADFGWYELRSLTVNSQTYFGRVGKAQWPWDPDYMVVLYRPMHDDTLDPVASVYVSATRTTPSTVTVK